MASSSAPYGVTEWRVGYNLSEPCGYTNIQDCPSIEFRTEFERRITPNRITGFTITVVGEYEEEVLTRTNKQAKRLAHIMTVRSGNYVTPTLTGYCVRTDPERRPDTERWQLNRMMIGVYDILQDIELDLNHNTIISILQNDDEFNQQLHHGSLAIGSEEIRQYENMITQFFQVIEKDTALQDYDKWKGLRDTLSHQEKLYKAKSEVEKWFGVGSFDFTANDEFDHDSYKNLERVKLEASNFKRFIMTYLNARI